MRTGKNGGSLKTVADPIFCVISGCQPHDHLVLSPSLEAAGHTVHCMGVVTPKSACDLPPGSNGLISFVSDQLDATVLSILARRGVKLIVQRAVGVDNIDLAAAARLGLCVAHVPAYSPESVAEHATALLLALARHFPAAIMQVREGNFSLEGLLGFSLRGKTVGIIGMGRIGQVFARIMRGFGCRVLAVARHPQAIEGVEWVAPDRMWREADVVSLHCPLSPETHHLVNAPALERTKHGLVLINTARGAVVDTDAVLSALDSGQLAAYGADVYENEARIFFRDCSVCGYDDALLKRLINHPRVLITPHQAFFTREALQEIAVSVTASVSAFARGERTTYFLID